MERSHAPDSMAPRAGSIPLHSTTPLWMPLCCLHGTEVGRKRWLGEGGAHIHIGPGYNCYGLLVVIIFLLCLIYTINFIITLYRVWLYMGFRHPLWVSEGVHGIYRELPSSDSKHLKGFEEKNSRDMDQ